MSNDTKYIFILSQDWTAFIVPVYIKTHCEPFKPWHNWEDSLRLGDALTFDTRSDAEQFAKQNKWTKHYKLSAILGRQIFEAALRGE